ncbi:hypothetical protein VTI74DRAFT_8061 [Chaetomium olivicolor]
MDRAFEGGSLGEFYREVPSYSPAGDFLQYARAIKTFRDICDAAPKPNALTTLYELECDMTCSLNFAADMLRLISDGLLNHPRVEPVLGTVTETARSAKTKQWTVTLTPDTISLTRTPVKFTAPMVIYCTGTRPQVTALPAPVSRISLETALSPSRLGRLLPRGEERTVAVLGDGFSAVLALRNLFRLAVISHRKLRIRWFTRTANLRYAEQTADGVILNEHNGLMGEAARFARTQLEGERLELGDARAYIRRVVFPKVGEAEQKGEETGREGKEKVEETRGGEQVVRIEVKGEDKQSARGAEGTEGVEATGGQEIKDEGVKGKNGKGLALQGVEGAEGAKRIEQYEEIEQGEEFERIEGPEGIDGAEEPDGVEGDEEPKRPGEVDGAETEKVKGPVGEEVKETTWAKRKRLAKEELERDLLEWEVLRKELKDVDYFVQATGFVRGRLPDVRPGFGPREGPLGKPKKLIFNPLTGAFFPSFGSRNDALGLFGAGSAFPESVFTSEGWRHPAVSVFKFMWFLKRMVPEWVDATSRGRFLTPEEKEGKTRSPYRYY